MKKTAPKKHIKSQKIIKKKVKREAPLINVTDSRIEEMGCVNPQIEALRGKKIVVRTVSDSYWEGIIVGYNLFKLDLKRGGDEIESIPFFAIHSIKILEN